MMSWITCGLGRTRALITSRFKLTDLERWEGAGYHSIQLDELDKQSAIDVLRAWGVKGDEKQLLALAESVGRHALSVSVLGSYLNHFCNGNPAGAQEFKLDTISVDEPQAAKLGRILAGYAKNLPAEERDLLVRLSVFPRGVSVELLVFLIDAGGDIAGALIGINQAKLLKLAERLYKQGLVYTYQLRNKITYTAHPFLREYFRNLLGVPPEKIHEVVRSKLAIGLDSKPEKKPCEIEILDKYEALIEQTILAGHFQNEYDLYFNTMGGGGGKDHLYHTLGDYGRIIRIVSLFAEDGEPEHIAQQLSLRERRYLISVLGLAADALGDLSIAERCLDVANKFVRTDKDSGEHSATLQNLACVAMARGAFPSAKKLLIESLEHANVEDAYRRSDSQGYLAATFHALGEIPEAQKNFTKATEINGGPLISMDGFLEAEHFFVLGDKKTAFERTTAILAACASILPRDLALCHTMLGILCLPDSVNEARNHLNKARDWTNQSGHMECIIRSHILATEIAYCSGDLPAAIAEAATGLNHAESCGYGQFAIDLLLQLAKTHLAIPDPRTALGNARKALDRSQHPDCQYAWGEANSLHLCGICHKELGEPELAKKRLEAALEVRTRIQHPGVEETRKILKELKV